MVSLKRGRHMEDLLDSVLVEIFCRLPCFKFVSQCKCVSKRWRTLISDPFFICCFLSVQVDRHNQTPEKVTLISATGEELTRSLSSTKLLGPLFDKLVSAYGLEKEPVVVGTNNDLVLCCATKDHQRDYYICNPYTTQCVPLPPPPQVYQTVAVGLKCDLPYYNVKKGDKEGHTIELKNGYRCRVVRIVHPSDEETFFTKFKVEIFSFETGVWTESIVSTPSDDLMCSEDLDYSRAFVYNGMLYWEGLASGDDEDTILIGVDPFMINGSTSGTSDIITDDQYKCRFVQLDGDGAFAPECLGVYGGCLRMCWLEYVDESRNLYVWDLNEEVDWRKAIDGGGAVRLPLQDTKKVYALDPRMFSLDEFDSENEADLLGFDPCNKGILYLCMGTDIVECNIHTKEWSIISGKRYSSEAYYPIVLPLWPTPVPTRVGISSTME